MKQSLLVVTVAVLALFAVAPPARGQGGAKPAVPVVRDPELEKDSLHHLEVARQYYKLRKAYVAALKRCEEVIAGYPDFSRIDEILFMAGRSSLNLADNKGKQPPSQYTVHEGDRTRTLTPDEFRDLARDYLSQIVNDHPASKFRKDAEEDLKALGGPKPKQ